jgi:hypothetical protein
MVTKRMVRKCLTEALEGVKMEGAENGRAVGKTLEEKKVGV